QRAAEERGVLIALELAWLRCNLGDGELQMTKIVYHIIQHDGGWAFKLGDTISETFRSHDAAYAAARRVALEQMRPGETAGISWEDARGRWHDEISTGDDRPDVEIEDD